MHPIQARRWIAVFTLTPWVPATKAVDVEPSAGPQTVIHPILRLQSEQARDQDDMCVWVHPTDPDQSTLITADKAAGRLFVYDLTGKVLQSIEIPEPGNIDLRNNIRFSGQSASLVVCNQRDRHLRLRVFLVDPRARTLTAVDDGNIDTDANYGGCLDHNPRSKKLYFISTTKVSGISQYEIFEKSAGSMSGRPVRHWDLGKSEGADADNESGILDIGEEEQGIWRVGAEPHDPTPGKFIIRVGEHGLEGDIEGLALSSRGHRLLLLLSDQGRSRFVDLDRDSDSAQFGDFACA